MEFWFTKSTWLTCNWYRETFLNNNHVPYYERNRMTCKDESNTKIKSCPTRFILKKIEINVIFFQITLLVYHVACSCNFR